jgi:hypothetical protein
MKGAIRRVRTGADYTARFENVKSGRGDPRTGGRAAFLVQTRDIAGGILPPAAKGYERGHA